MSFERWIRCDGCGNALPLDDDAGVPSGWLVVTPEPEKAADEERVRSNEWLFFSMTPTPPRPSKHLCSWTCAEKLAAISKAPA